MKFKFDPDNLHQKEAIDSVVSLFVGQPNSQGMTFTKSSHSFSLNFSNQLLISDENILQNLQNIQQKIDGNNFSLTQKLETKNFSVEMETGTGKTYTYLRTIYELDKKYNFQKYIIVVPSIAIKEGVLKNLEITKTHFQNLYRNSIVEFDVYEPSKISKLRYFLSKNTIQILIISIDSFTRSENIINKPNDKLNGHIPLHFLQKANPIVILDEPQNMETDKRKKAIRSLNPLFTLRYSATHKNYYNLVYRLDPVKAYEKGLVKQIEVYSNTTQDDRNNVFVALKKITNQNQLKAQISLYYNVKGMLHKKTIKAITGSDLYDLSNQNDAYQDNFQIKTIDYINQEICFANGQKIAVGQSQGGFTAEIMKSQIQKTIKIHLDKEKELKEKGIKVLSLFFIDQVNNYRQYDETNKPKLGKIAQWFEEAYRTECPQTSDQEIQALHNGYFAKDKKGLFKNSFKGETEADYDTYKLIMKDKEKLLTLSNPLRFIFSHSALKEGWDNPNVFQICTLNETKSEIKKRQEVGRGLRFAS